MAPRGTKEACRFCGRPITGTQMDRHVRAKHPDEDPDSPFVMAEVDAPAAARPGRRIAPVAPSGITGKGKVLWDGVVRLYDLRPDELRILEDACREAVLIDKLDRTLGAGSVLVEGSRGQPRISPIVAEIRQHRATLTRMLATLHLPNDPAEELPGRAPALTEEEKASARSTAARKAAHARWRRA